MTLKNFGKSLGFVTGLCGAMAISACASLGEVETEAEPVSTTTIADKVMEWWQGDYSNDAQISFLKQDGAPIWRQGQAEEGQTFGGHLPVHSYYRTLDRPDFGARVIYLEEFTFENNPYRQRIYTVIEDEANDQVRVKLWYFPDKTTYAGAFEDLSKLDDLSPEDMSPLPDNCDLYINELEDGRLEMKMPRDACKFGSSIFDYQVILSADDFWFRDRIVDAESMLVKMTAGSFTYHEMDRVSNR